MPAVDEVQARVLRALLGLQRAAWEQGVTGHALLDLGLSGLARAVARGAVLRQAPDGRLGEVGDPNVVNGAANLEVVRWAGHAEAYRRQLDWVLHRAPRAADGTVFHVEGTRQVWVDTVYMLVPPLAQDRYAEAAGQQLAGHRDRLFDPAAGLYAHQWDEDRGERTRPQRWGGGNGWVVAAIARSGLRGDWAGHAREVVDAMLAHRAPSGLFHDVLDDPASFEEVTAGLMLAYAILTMVADGRLPGRYAGHGADLVDTGRRHVDEDGFLSPACGAPHFDRPGVSAESQAFFLLATAAQSRLR